MLYAEQSYFWELNDKYAKIINAFIQKKFPGFQFIRSSYLYRAGGS